MYATVPQPLLDGQYKPTDFLRTLPGGSPHRPGAPAAGPFPSTPFTPQTPTLLPGGQGQQGGGLNTILPQPVNPVLRPNNPVPQTHAPSIAQMRQMVTQLHMQQMMARMQKHVQYHSGQ